MNLLEELQHMAVLAYQQEILKDDEQQKRFDNVIEEIIADLRSHASQGKFARNIYLSNYEFLMPCAVKMRESVIERMEAHGLKAIPMKDLDKGISFSWERS